MIKFNPAPLFQPRVEKNVDPPPRLSTPPPKEKCRPPTSFWTIRTLHIGRDVVICGQMWSYVVRCGLYCLKEEACRPLSILHKCLICICLLIQVCWVCGSNNPGDRLMYAY